MSITRTIERNKLKEKYESNKIQKAWRNYQINKYSIQGYVNLRKNKKITPKTVYDV